MAIERSRLRWNGWGPLEQPDPTGGSPAFWTMIGESLGMDALPETPALPIEAVKLAAPLDPEDVAALEALVGQGSVSTDRRERAARARGRSYPDLIALRSGDATGAPAAVVLPATAEQVLALFRFAARRGLKLVPFGGGTSVVGGVSGPRDVPWIAVESTRMDGLLELRETDLVATVGAGMDGPGLEAALNSRGYTLGHFPQSFRQSTVGGWIAASGAGQQSGRYGRPSDWLVSAEVATPAGLWHTDRFPRNAAGPRLAALVVGSEGTLGVITRATIRIRPLPEVRDYRGYLLPDFERGADAVRAIVQAGVPAAMLRLSDSAETRFLGAVSRLGRRPSLRGRAAGLYIRARGMPRSACLLVAGFEGSAGEVRRMRREAERHITRVGGIRAGRGPGRSWYRTRFDGPALRDELLARGVGADSVETATFWSGLTSLHAIVRGTLERSVTEQSPRGGRPVVLGHLSHSYPEGGSLYFTWLFPQSLGAELEQWQAIKTAVSAAISAAGATISHHHGIGEDHRPWVVAEKGELGVELLRAAKARLDPDGLLNPGKLIP